MSFNKQEALRICSKRSWWENWWENQYFYNKYNVFQKVNQTEFPTKNTLQDIVEHAYMEIRQDPHGLN